MLALVRLASGDLELVLRAGALAGLVSLRHRGAELLAAPAALPDPYRVHGRAAGLTLLHPWANRVHGDRFAARGTGVVIGDDPAVTRDKAGAAIHGLAVEGTFALRADGPAAVLAGRWAGHDAFPFAHELDARVEVRPGAVTIVTTLRATGGVAVPVCFGWHPYFTMPGAPRATWEVGAPGVPPAALGARTFDDPVPGGRMTLAGGGLRIEVAPDEAAYPAGQLFAPGDRDVVSLEPMTAPSDALRTGEGLRWVEPGGSFTAAFSVFVAGGR